MNAINIGAPSWHIAESYGRIAHELRNAFMRQGWHVNTVGEDQPCTTVQPVLGGILLAYPTHFHKFGAMLNLGKRLAVTMFESTKLPEGWVEELNQCAAVIVPSEWLVELFKKEGVRVPVTCVPLGVDHQTFAYVERDPTRQPFTFIAYMDRFGRKGWHSAGSAFMKAFGDDPNYRLIFKARKAQPFPFRIGNPNIQILAEDYTDAEMAQFYADADCLLFPTSGEGFGLPPREFAATGGTAITTNWSGTQDNLESWGIPLNNFNFVPAWDRVKEFRGLGVWAEADIDELAAKMIAVAQNREQYHAKGKIASEFVHKHYQWSFFTQQVMKIWEGL